MQVNKPLQGSSTSSLSLYYFDAVALLIIGFLDNFVPLWKQ